MDILRLFAESMRFVSEKLTEEKIVEQNVIGWFEIYVENMARAKKFYEAVFSVELSKIESDELDYWAFPWKENGYGAGGALAKMDGVSPGAGGTLIYFMCEDCALEESRVVSNGGEVVKTKFSLGPHGFSSIVKDPEGNVIGLHSMK